MIMRYVEEAGVCECTYEPRGDYGLEGFMLGYEFKYEIMKYGKSKYHRIYINDTYYETCSPTIFNKHFKLINTKIMSQIKFCYHKQLPTVVNESIAVRAISLKHSYWEVGQTIRYLFLDKPEWVSPVGIEDIKDAMKRISKVCNLDFSETDDPEVAEIRIGFRQNEGAWSYPGVHSLRTDIPKTEPTLNLGWIDYETALHELCHAIGMMHEHQHFGADFEWDEEAVYADTAAMGWTKGMTKHNILNTYSPNDVDSGDYDPLSIMHYWFPANWVKSGSLPEKPNDDLSELDIKHLQMLYPFTATIEEKEEGECKEEEEDGVTYPVVLIEDTMYKDALLGLFKNPSVVKITEEALLNVATALEIEATTALTKSHIANLIRTKLSL